MHKELSNLKFVLIIIACFWSSVVFGQISLTTQVEVTKLSGSAVELLFHIETQANVVFSYSNKVCLTTNVVFDKRVESLKYFLDVIFANCKVDYTVSGNKILIVPSVTKTITVSGFVRDSINGEALIGATVFVVNGTIGTTTNEKGFFSLSIDPISTVIGCSYIGYDRKYVSASFNNDSTLQIRLNPNAQLSEVAVVGVAPSMGLMSSLIGSTEVPLNQVKNVPTYLGEADLIKSIQLLPGVQGGNEGSNGLFVRGGATDQNLILIDDVPVYNIDHLLGFFSVFNPDAINQVSFMKGGFPAQYGGRLSSVLDVRTNDGDVNKHNGSVSIGLLSLKASFNGPIVKQKTTYAFSFRRTFFDILSAPFVIQSSNATFYRFYDINAKLTHRFSPRSTLTISSYWGSDELETGYNYQSFSEALTVNDNDSKGSLLNDKIATGWGNFIPSIRWNYVISQRLTANVAASYNNYRFYSEQSERFFYTDSWVDLKRRYFSGIEDFTGRVDLFYAMNNNNRVRFGINYTKHQFYPGIDVAQFFSDTEQVNDTTVGGKVILGDEFHAYLQDDFSFSNQIRINAGCHFSGYNSNGKVYAFVEPRINARWLLMPKMALKASYASMVQYQHVLTATTMSLPSDLWLPVTDQIKPIQSWQIDFGPVWEFAPGYSFSIEGYYKKQKNILEYKENQSFFDFSTSWADKLTAGKGISYGVDMLLHRKVGKLSGWIGYSLSKHTNYFEELNNGEPFRSNFDRRHNATFYLTYKLKHNIDFGGVWTFASGKPFTLVDEKYEAYPTPTSMAPLNSVIQNYGSKNGYTMPSYHRLDICANFYKQRKNGERIWTLGIMNVYGRNNPFFVYYSKDLNIGESNYKLKQFSLFPFPMPYFRYTINF